MVYDKAKKAGKLNQLPSNQSPHFAPVIHPTLERDVKPLIVAAHAWLHRERHSDARTAPDTGGSSLSVPVHFRGRLNGRSF